MGASLTPVHRTMPFRDSTTEEVSRRHFYFSHRLSPLLGSTPRPNTMQGVDFGSILGQCLVSSGQK